MARTAITKALLRDLPPPPEGTAKVRVFDDRLVGFIAERRRNGITFYLRYTDHRGRGREVKLGRLGDVTLDQARRQGEQLRARVSMGGDPVAERTKRRAVPLFADFARDRYLPHMRERLRNVVNPEAQLRLRIIPFLGRKALDEINQDDVASLRRKLLAEGLSGATVNRHLATLRSMFNLALRWQLFEGRNPAASPGMLPEQHRDKFLTATETRALVKALDQEANRDAASALALLILTGARKQEVLRARWEFVDLDRGVLTVPLSKSGRPRHVPLSPAAVRVLEGQAQRRVSGNPFVFPSRILEGKPLEGLRKPWDKAKKAAGLAADLRIHDLRHSLASALANAGTPLYEIGAVLGHRQLSTTTRYAHHSPQRMIETATVAERTWNLLPGPEAVED
jgi:integrase